MHNFEMAREFSTISCGFYCRSGREKLKTSFWVCGGVWVPQFTPSSWLCWVSTCAEGTRENGGGGEVERGRERERKRLWERENERMKECARVWEIMREWERVWGSLGGQKKKNDYERERRGWEIKREGMAEWESEYVRVWEVMREYERVCQRIWESEKE